MLKQKIIENKIPDITNLTTKTNFDAKMNMVKGDMSSITKLATKNSLNAVENKTASVRNLVKKN